MRATWRSSRAPSPSTRRSSSPTSSAAARTEISGDRPTSEKENKALVHRFVEEVFERLSVDAVDELVADDFVSHTWPSPTGDGKADLKAATERVKLALSDIQFSIEDMIAEGDRVAVRVTASATQTGEFMKMPPSGKHYSIGEIHIFRVSNGQIAEHWHQLDAMGMMSQLKPDAE